MEQTALALLGTLLASGVGAYLSNLASTHVQERRRIAELRQRSYSKLLSLKSPWGQAIVSHLQAGVIAKYHHAKWQLRGDTYDRDQAARFFDKADQQIGHIVQLQREAFDVLGDVRLHFKLNAPAQQAITTLLALKAKTVDDPLPAALQSPEALHAWKEWGTSTADNIPNQTLNPAIDTLLTAMHEQLE